MRPIYPHTLQLDKLWGGIPALSVGVGIAMIEACMVCFDDVGHESGVELTVGGSFGGAYRVIWSDGITEDMRRYWRDTDEATEYAAYGIALLLIEELTGYTPIERSDKGTGFDFWLGHTVGGNREARYEARLEVSGIRRGSKQQISSRAAQKMVQTDISDGPYPAYIVVVEFSAPMAQVVKK